MSNLTDKCDIPKEAQESQQRFMQEIKKLYTPEIRKALSLQRARQWERK